MAQQEHVCPECGRKFKAAAGLGRHRTTAHGTTPKKQKVKRGAKAIKTAQARVAAKGRALALVTEYAGDVERLAQAVTDHVAALVQAAVDKAAKSRTLDSENKRMAEQLKRIAGAVKSVERERMYKEG